MKYTIQWISIVLQTFVEDVRENLFVYLYHIVN